MASTWFYQIDGGKHGPVSSRELANLAQSGKLKPTDLVQKGGMSDWQPASRVKGLFPSTAPAALSPPPPPSVVAAAKGLFNAVANAAKRVSEKMTEAAKQTQPKPSTLDAMPEQTELPKMSRRTKTMAGVGCGVLLLSFAACGLIGLFVDTGGGEIEAKLTAQSFVEKRLKAPSTAEFPSTTDFKATKIEKNVWRVSSYVDAQNSFGAKIRDHWVVTMRYEGDSKWALISCDFSD